MSVLRYPGLLILCLMGGCFMIPRPVVRPSGYYYLDRSANFASVGRVAVLELRDGNVPDAGLGKSLTHMLSDSLGKKYLFSIRTICRTDPEWNALNLDQASSFTEQDLIKVRKQLNVDAILIGTITRYQPYPKLLLAMNLKLMDIRSNKLLWAIEDVWDSTDKNVELRIKQFFKSQMRTGYQPMDWQIVINSPTAFHKFVMYEVACTLPENR